MMRLIVAVFLALVLCPSLTPADETTTVAEGLFQKLRTGDIEGARTEYLRSLDTVFERLRGEPKVPIPNDKAAGDLANLVQIATDSLAWLDLSETYIRLTGGTTPDDVLAKILDAAHELGRRAKALRDVEPKVSDAVVKREIDSALKKTGKVLLHTTVFLLGTPMDGRRGEIFRMAAECVNVPYSFEAFNAKYNSLETLDRAPFTSSGKTLDWGK